MKIVFCAFLIFTTAWPALAAADGGAYDDQIIPGKWINDLLPENVTEPAYASYDKDSPLQRARAQVQAGQYRRALVTLESVSRGNKAQIALVAAEAKLALGRFAEAIATLSAPGVADDPEAKILRTQVLAAQGDFKAAISVLKDVIATQPNSIAARYYLGEYREKQGDVPAAREAYQWFVSGDHNYLQQWQDHPTDFNDAREVTLIGRAVDRWATLTMAYQERNDLHDTILGMFVRAYDLIDRDYWAAHVAAAEYFLSHDDPDQAKAELEQSLGANNFDVKSWALLGRIELDQFNFDHTEDAVIHMRMVNADSVDADLLEARDYLQQRAAEMAVAPLDRVLKRQPDNIEAIGLLAATQALLLHSEKMDELLKRVEKLDANNASAYQEVADQLGSMRQYPRAAQMYKIAIERAPWWSSPRNGLGLLYTQSGDENASRQVLQAAHTLDPFNPRTTNYLRLLDTMAGYARKESAHFIVIYDAKKDPVIPEYFGEYLESIYPKTTGEYHYEPAQKTLIEVFPTHDEFSVRTTGGPWIATVGASSGRVIALVTPRKGERTMGAFNWSQVLRHEFTHTVTLGATDNRIAHWFTEGLAVREENVPMRWEWVPMLYDAVTKHHLLAMEDLTWGFIRPRRPIDRALAYAESNWICQYIEETYGHPAILGMLDEFRQGHSQDQVFQNVLHKNQAEFFDEFQTWCQKQIAGWGYDPVSSAQYEQLRAQGEDFIQNGEFDKAAGIYEQIARLRPVDLLPHQRLAGLYTQANQLQKAAEQLDLIAATDQKNNLYAKGAARMYRDMGQLDVAAQRALFAVYVDPYDPAAHKLLADIYEKMGDKQRLARERRVLDILAHWQESSDADSDAAPTARDDEKRVYSPE